MWKIRFVAALLSFGVVGCGPHQGHGGSDAGSGGGPDLAVGDDFGVPGGDMAGPLVIAPLDQVVTYAPGGALPTVQYTASINGASVAPAWTIDRGEIGAIGVSDGKFVAAGGVGGTAHVTATYLGQTATTTITVTIKQTQNGNPDNRPATPGPGGYGGVGGDGPAPAASGGQVGTLGGTPTPDANVHILYPYDGTVWPRGLLAPSIQWDPATHTIDAVMIKLHEKSFDYTGTFGVQPGVANMINAPIPQDVWHTLTYSNGGAGDDVTVTIVLADKTTQTAIGPYTLTWHIAPGTLKGTVYYNSYGTGLLTNSGETSCGNAGCSQKGPEFGAATLGIKPGATDPVVMAGTSTPGSNTGCRVCHSVSANGATLITQHGDDYDVSSLFDLKAADPPTTDTAVAGTGHAFPALAPDGSWFLSSAGGMINGDGTSQAYLASGALMAPQPTGLPAGLKASLPVFSPDGKHLAFNFWASTSAGGDQKSLAALDYDAASKTFSNLRTLVTPAAGVVSWSSFLPTSDAIVYEDELASSHYGYTWINGQGQLYWIDLATKTAHALDMLNGTGYLPSYGAHTGSADEKLNYEPTVNPVVSGGYAWVVFTSRRLYGNVATTSAYDSDPRKYDWKHVVTPKKLWVAAIDLKAPPGTDPSHPAFYLPGQELYAGNSRAFWTVDPCHPDGNGCETGDECCGGYCRPGGDGGALICTNQQPSCSQEYEKCMQTSDCCGAAQGVMCINGICGKTAPIP